MQLGILKALYTDTLTKVYNRSEAENIFYIVLECLEKKSKTDVIVGSETLLKETYLDILGELQKGVPVQYLTQEAPFYGLDFFVDERVLIPRPETEQLVHLFLEENKGFKGRILDIGTGSGCIPIIVKKYMPQATISACDISPEALEVAEMNKKTFEVDIHLFECDILKDEIEDYDIIISNPPYIAKEEKVKMNKNVLHNEPHLALFVQDADPLMFYKRIIRLAMLQKTTCYFETSEFYRTSFDEWLEKQILNYEWKDDFQGKNRILKVDFQ